VVDIAPNLIVPLTTVGGTTFSSDGPDAVNAGAGTASFDGGTGFLEGDHTAVNASGDYTISA
jgi:hypothetical protein